MANQTDDPTIAERRKEQARKRDDQKLVTDGNRECQRCDGNEFVRTYYDHLAPDTTCVNCGKTT